MQKNEVEEIEICKKRAVPISRLNFFPGALRKKRSVAPISSISRDYKSVYSKSIYPRSCYFGSNDKNLDNVVSAPVIGETCGKNVLENLKEGRKFVDFVDEGVKNGGKEGIGGVKDRNAKNPHCLSVQVGDKGECVFRNSFQNKLYKVPYFQNSQIFLKKSFRFY